MSSLLFFGTGGSLGIPVIGCSCSVCKSDSPFNQRLRPSVLLMIGEKRFIIDVGPDFRQQMLRYKVGSLTGALLTHLHYDHIGGLDDLRALYFLMRKKIPLLLSQETLEELNLRYNYLLRPSKFDFIVPDADSGEMDFQGVKITYFSYSQQKLRVLGFRIGDLAYVTDIKEYSEDVFIPLKGIKTLILSAPRVIAMNFHLSLQEALLFAKKTKAEKTYITHISHDMEPSLELPKGMAFAYDGLKLTFV